MIGIVILNYETWDVTLKCIKSIVKTETTEKICLYLVDNASTSSMPEELKKYIAEHNVTYITSRKIVATRREIILEFKKL